MLVWKVIAANPGITRQGIWDHVEHSIPAGYATRLYIRCAMKSTPDAGGVDLRRARGFVLTLILQKMRTMGTVVWQGNGKERQYVAHRQPVYFGDPEMIDVDGSKAADHLTVADALRRIEGMLVRAARAKEAQKRGSHSGSWVRGSQKDYDALQVLVKALRAKGPVA
jgi:hypothetical protein